MDAFQREIAETEKWFADPRFDGITRLYTAQQVVEQRGSIATEYAVARDAAAGFYARLRDLFAQRRQITTFGPYSPGQAVIIKRMGIEGIYLGGWATSAKGSVTEDPGPDLASYPLSQVPDEAASLVRALLAADKNQFYARARMSPEQRKTTPEIDYRPFIIADADTGHGGEAHVRNLIRRFVEVGVPGYHIEDQKPGVKKCGHQAGKVLVQQDEQIKRLNSARFQLDLMKVPGIIVARTDAEAATFLDGRGDERDHPFILGATNIAIPSYKVAYLAVMKRFHDRGIKDINGHLLYAISEAAYDEAYVWLQHAGVLADIDKSVEAYRKNGASSPEKLLDQVSVKFLDLWQMEAGLKTYAQSVADVMKFHVDEGSTFELGVSDWHNFAARVSFPEARAKARSMGINIIWDPELSRTAEGYYQIQGGVGYAAAKSIAVAPYADLLWMETKTAHLGEAREFAEAVHAVYPDKMLAYNLSPSFNWDTTGMTEEEMQSFPEELGKLGYVFNFITYGGHQVDGLAAEEFATALKDDGMMALARLQRKLRLIESPYRTPQTYVGGPRSDAALMACSGLTATTKAMGKGSTQFQHLVQTELPPKVLAEWLKDWAAHYEIPETFRVELRPHHAGSDLLVLNVMDGAGAKAASVTFANLMDRRNRAFLSVRDQHTFKDEMRQKRLMTLIHLFLIHRYKAEAVHYITPTEDNQAQCAGMRALGIYGEVNTEIGQIIVARVNAATVKLLMSPDRAELRKLIAKSFKAPD